MGIITEKIEGKVILVEIQSSNLKSAKYNTESEDLEITFNNNSVYEYKKVPWMTFTQLRKSESQGKFFNSNIAKKFDYKRIV